MTSALEAATKAEELEVAIDDCYSASALLALSSATVRNIIEDKVEESLPGLLKVIELITHKMDNIHRTLELIEMASKREQAA